MELMENAVEIKKIVLNLGGAEIHLTLGQAMELRDILDRTFGHSFSYPYPVYPYPVIKYYPDVYPVYTSWASAYDSQTLILSVT